MPIDAYKRQKRPLFQNCFRESICCDIFRRSDWLDHGNSMTSLDTASFSKDFPQISAKPRSQAYFSKLELKDNNKLIIFLQWLNVDACQFTRKLKLKFIVQRGHRACALRRVATRQAKYDNDLAVSGSENVPKLCCHSTHRTQTSHAGRV